MADVSDNYLEMSMDLQQHLCRMFSHQFVGIKKMELTSFIAVMRLVKLEYSTKKPELFKMLISILHDYDPSLGTEHFQKTVQYILILLEKHPELADYLTSILPPPVGASALSHNAVAHTLHSVAVNSEHSLPDSKQDGPQNETVFEPAAKKAHTMESSPKFYNYTPPSLSAYVASQGIPQKIITMATSSSTNLPAPSEGQPWNLLVDDKGAISLTPADVVSKFPRTYPSVLSCGHFTTPTMTPSVRLTTSRTPVSWSGLGSVSNTGKPSSIIITKDALKTQGKSPAGIKSSSLHKPMKWTLTLDQEEVKKRQSLQNEKPKKETKNLSHLKTCVTTLMKTNPGVTSSMSNTSGLITPARKRSVTVTGIPRSVPVTESAASRVKSATHSLMSERRVNSFPYNQQIILSKPCAPQDSLKQQPPGPRASSGTRPNGQGRLPILRLQRFLGEAPHSGLSGEATKAVAASPSGIYPTIAKSLQSGHKALHPKVSKVHAVSYECDSTVSTACTGTTTTCRTATAGSTTSTTPASGTGSVGSMIAGSSTTPAANMARAGHPLSVISEPLDLSTHSRISAVSVSSSAGCKTNPSIGLPQKGETLVMKGKKYMVEDPAKSIVEGGFREQEDGDSDSDLSYLNILRLIPLLK